MKRIVLFIAITLFVTILANAQVFKSLSVSAPGSLSTDLTIGELASVTNLTLTGSIDAWDFRTMYLMPALTIFEICSTAIAEYVEKEGTRGISNQVYPADAIPVIAFNEWLGPGYFTSYPKTSLTTVLLSSKASNNWNGRALSV